MKASATTGLKELLADIKNDNKINPEYTKLAQLAYDTVIATMLEGEKTHTGNEWQELREMEHIIHINDHIENYQYNLLLGTKSTENHIANALTRCAMMICLRHKCR